MRIRQLPILLAQTNGSLPTEPRWVPRPPKIEWPFVAGALTVTAIAAAMALIKSK